MGFAKKSFLLNQQVEKDKRRIEEARKDKKESDDLWSTVGDVISIGAAIGSATTGIGAPLAAAIAGGGQMLEHGAKGANEQEYLGEVNDVEVLNRTAEKEADKYSGYGKNLYEGAVSGAQNALSAYLASPDTSLETLGNSLFGQTGQTISQTTNNAGIPKVFDEFNTYI